MKCSDCLYNDNCSLKEIAKDITGCEGHSKERLPRENEIKCGFCGRFVIKERVFTNTEGKNAICFDCW